jgi:transcriptional regulator with XRE-family HTH domain
MYKDIKRKGNPKTAEEKDFDIVIGKKIKQIAKLRRILQPEASKNIGVDEKTVSFYYNGKTSLSAYRLFQFINLLNLSDSEIVSLFKDSDVNTGQRKEIKQPELVKMPEPETDTTQKYCGIIKKAYDMQDSNPEIKGKIDMLFNMICNIESDIKKIKKEKKENASAGER